MNISGTTESTDNYNWLAERNGIAIATALPNFELKLNSHAMLIFGLDNNQININELSKEISDLNGFKTFLENTTNETREFKLNIQYKNTKKEYLVSGIRNTNTEYIDLTFQAYANLNNSEYLCQYAIHSSDVFAICNKENELLFINQNFEKLFERDRSDLKGDPNAFFKWVIPEDNFKLEQLCNRIGMTNAEFRVQMPDNRIKWIWHSRKALYDRAGNIYRHLGVFTDITKIKEAEEQLLISKTSFEQNQNPIYWFDKDANIKYINQAACNVLGYSFSELKSKKAFDLCEDMSEEKWPIQWQSFKKNKVDTHQTNYIKKDGTKITFEVDSNFLELDNKEYMFAFAIDISKRRDIEKRIQYLQDFEHLLFEISKRFITIPYNEVDSSINNAFKEICAFTKTDAAHIYTYNTAIDAIELTHYFSETNRKINNSKLRRIPISSNSWHFKQLTSEEVVHIPYISQLPNNDDIKKHCVEVEIGSLIDIPLFYQKRIIGFFGITCEKGGRKWEPEEIQLLQVIGDMFMNVLQRRDFMKELLESEQDYREIYNATNEAIFIHNAETGVIEDVNDAMLKMYGLTYEQALQSNIADLSAKKETFTQEMALTLIHEAIEEPQIKEWLSIKSTGETFWTEVAIKKADINGTPKVIAVVRDISERIKAQNLLNDNVSKYKMIVEGQSDLIVKLDETWCILFASPSFEKVFALEEQEIIGQNFLNFVHPQEKDLVTIAMEKMQRPPHTCFFEFNVQLKAGMRWFAWKYTGIKDKEQKTTNFIGVGRDITYQKMVESALRESEDRFRSIVQNLSDVVFLIDEKANIKYVTPSCEEYLGLAVEELLGENVLNLIHNDDKWLAEENFNLHIEGSDYSIPYEVRLKHKSNIWKVFEAKSQNLLKHPAVNSIIFTISDITERKLMEKQVLDAIIKTEEKERERFAKDLHDDLGPLLSSIKMYIGMLKKVDKKEKQDYIIKNLQEIVKEAITTTKDVSNDLNPHVLNNYGLISALRLFIDKLSEELNIEFIEEIGDSRYSTAIELSLYRITKELINNTLKHANATQIKINVAERGNSLNLIFADNGKGLPEGALKVKKPGGMGLSNIISRAKSLNAKYSFHSNLKNGFNFEMQVPLIQE